MSVVLMQRLQELEALRRRQGRLLLSEEEKKVVAQILEDIKQDTGFVRQYGRVYAEHKLEGNYWEKWIQKRSSDLQGWSTDQIKRHFLESQVMYDMPASETTKYEYTDYDTGTRDFAWRLAEDAGAPLRTHTPYRLDLDAISYDVHYQRFRQLTETAAPQEFSNLRGDGNAPTELIASWRLGFDPITGLRSPVDNWMIFENLEEALLWKRAGPRLMTDPEKQRFVKRAVQHRNAMLDLQGAIRMDVDKLLKKVQGDPNKVIVNIYPKKKIDLGKVAPATSGLKTKYNPSKRKREQKKRRTAQRKVARPIYKIYKPK